MKVYLIKPDLTYYDDYNEMMREWCDSNTQIAPWFPDEPIPTIDETRAVFSPDILKNRLRLLHARLQRS